MRERIPIGKKKITGKKEKEMNQQQKNYAMNRVSEVCRGKVQEVRETVEADELSDDHIWELAQKKKIKLHKELDTYNWRGNGKHYSLVEIFDVDKLLEPSKKDQRWRDQMIEKIEKRAQAIKDNIMLGDAEEALRAIKELESLEIKR